LRLLRRAASLAVAAGLVAAAPASAFGPAAFRFAPGGAPAACLQSAADRLAYVAGDTSTPDVEVLAPTRLAADLEPAGSLRLGPMLLCPRVAAAPGGTIAAAGWTGLIGRLRIRATFADPGLPAAPPVVLAEPKGTTLVDSDSLAVAVGERGDVVVAWAEAFSGERDAARIRAVRRPAGGTFGVPETLSGPYRVKRNDTVAALAAGVDAAGTATVAWTRQASKRAPVVVEAATASEPGLAFGRAQRLAEDAEVFTPPAVAVTPEEPGSGPPEERGSAPAAPRADALPEERGSAPAAPRADAPPEERGSALVAYGGDHGLGVHERRGARESFGPRVTVGDGDAAAPTAALTPDGGAALAWRTTDDGSSAGGVALATRTPGGDFGRPERVALGSGPRSETDGGSTGNDFDGFVRALGGILSVAGTFLDIGPASPDLALAPDGRFALAWVGTGCRCPGGDEAVLARGVSGTLAEGAGPPHGPGSRLRAADAAAAFVAHGDPAIAWSDHDGGWVGPGFEAPWAAGRIGAASAAGAFPTLATAPGLRVAVPPQGVRRWSSLAVRVTCDAACDVRGAVPGAGGPVAAGSAVLFAPGTTTLRLRLQALAAAPRRPLVVVSAAPPGGGPIATVRARARIRRLRPGTPPRIVDLAARRDGPDVVATWRTTAPVEGALMIAAIGSFDDDGVAVPASGGTRFTARLEPPDPRRAVRVKVELASLGARWTRRASVVVPAAR
jgi:hypothetical protein